MPTLTVKLDKKRADRLNNWARILKTTRSQIIREMIDREGPVIADDLVDHAPSILTADDLIEVCRTSAGRGLGLAQKRG